MLLDDQGEAEQPGDKDHIKVTGPTRMEIAASHASTVLSTGACRRGAPHITSRDQWRCSMRRSDLRRLVLNTTDGSVTGMRIGGDTRFVRATDRPASTRPARRSRDTDGSIVLEANRHAARAAG